MMQLADVPAARRIACKPFASCWDLSTYTIALTGLYLYSYLY